jgi:predicted MFS family arabinose efflux permease
VRNCYYRNARCVTSAASLFRWTFIIAAICGVTGILVTYFFVPDMTGEDLAEEDARFMEFLERNGWEGTVGEDEDVTR